MSAFGIIKNTERQHASLATNWEPASTTGAQFIPGASPVQLADKKNIKFVVEGYFWDIAGGSLNSDYIYIYMYAQSAIGHWDRVLQNDIESINRRLLHQKTTESAIAKPSAASAGDYVQYIPKTGAEILFPDYDFDKVTAIKFALRTSNPAHIIDSTATTSYINRLNLGVYYDHK